MLRPSSLVLLTLVLSQSASAQVPRDSSTDRERRGRRNAPNLMFEAIDADGDGVISLRELRKAAAALKQLDRDADGSLTLDEVTPGRGGLGGIDPQQFVEEMLKNDRNGDDRLTPDEVPEDAMPKLRGGDTDGDGAIDRRELEQIAQREGRGRARGRGRGPQGGPGQGGPGAFIGRKPEQIAEQLMAGDTDGDGMLSPEEVPRWAMRMLRGADLDQDGKINPLELAQAAERISQGPPQGGQFGRSGRPDPRGDAQRRFRDNGN